MFNLQKGREEVRRKGRFPGRRNLPIRNGCESIGQYTDFNSLAFCKLKRRHHVVICMLGTIFQIVTVFECKI